MIRGLFKMTGFLLAMAALGFVLTGVWIVHDGMRDDFDHADVALVPGYVEIQDATLSPALTARLDRAAALYTQGKFTYIIVSGVTPPNEDDEADAMAKYLQAHQVPASAIIQDHRGEKDELAANIARIMQDQKFHSVLLVADYDHLTRMKMTLKHAGIRETEQAHVGEWQRADGMDVLREDVAIYGDLYHWVVLPTAVKVNTQATIEAQKAKETLDKKIDSLKK